jgi:hypothetical protein
MGVHIMQAGEGTIFWAPRDSARILAWGSLSLLLVACGGEPDQPSVPEPETPAGARFVEIQEEAGLIWAHQNGGAGDYYLVETFGSGGGILDFDGDGLEDIYLIQGGAMPGYTPTGPVKDTLFRNEGGGRFRQVDGLPDRRERLYGMGFCSGDIDNDGDADIYSTAHGSNALLVNQGDGSFRDATEEAGVGDESFGSSCAFADVDRDGALDIYVVNYVDFTLENNKPCEGTVSGLPAYCHPDVYDGVSDILYRNNMDGTFTDATREVGLFHPEGKGLGVVTGDYDGDGDTDIYVANDSVANFLFENDGTGRFTDEGLFAGVAYNEDGQTEAGMGVDMGDLDNDGDSEFYVTHLDMETNTLYVNHGDKTFTDLTFPSGFGEPSMTFVGFGINFIDFDNDGDLDTFVANGHILDNAEMFNQSVTYEQRPHLFVNQGGMKFEELGRRHGAFFSVESVARGSASFDMDGDGDLDLLVTYNNKPVKLIRCEGDGDAHWLRVRTIGRASNRDGIGVQLGLEAGGRRQIREIRAGSSYLSRSSTIAHFGLGSSESVDRLELRWPSGESQLFENVPADRLLVVDESEGIITR